MLGCAPRALEHPEDAEVWVVNGPAMPPRWDRLFQLHGIDHISQKHPGYPAQLAEIRAPKRLYMTRTYKWIPAAERFPIEELRAQAGDYFTNSFPMLIAYAVMEGATEIILDGVMWVGGAQPQYGAGEGWAIPCIEYHIGRARALGVTVTVPPGSGLFAASHYIYGFEGPGSV